MTIWRRLKKSMPLGWGILGTGSIARKFAGELGDSRTGRLVAVGSRSETQAEKFAGAFGNPKAWGSYEGLLSDGEVDAVYIALPHPLHAKWAIAAAEAGKHILCEKPLTVNHADAMALVEAARRHGVFLMEAFMYRCHERTRRIVELIRDGVVGEVQFIEAKFCFAASFRPEGRLFSDATAGGAILDVGCYTMSVARLVAGAALGRQTAEPVKVAGAASMLPTGVDGLSAASLEFPGGIVAQLACAVSAAVGSDLIVRGTRGTMRVPNFWNPPGPIELAGPDGCVSRIETDPNPKKYALEADAVADSLPGLECEFVPWADTLGNMLALDRWRQSVGLTYSFEKPGHETMGLPVSGRPLKFNRWGEIPPVRLEGFEKPLSRLVLGCDNQPGQSHMNAIADDFFERGGHTFDTAWLYGGGKIERCLGEWVRTRGVRDEVVTITKGAHTPFCHPDAMVRQLVESLERKKFDYADIYMMHRDNPDVPVGEFVDVLNDLQKKGLVKRFGASNWTLERLIEANAYTRKNGLEPFRCVSNNLSLARMVEPIWAGCQSAKDDRWREWLLGSDCALFAWSSQARGYFVPGLLESAKPGDEVVRCWDAEDNRERRARAFALADKYGVSPLNIALAWVLCQPFPTFALVGPRTISELASTMPALGVRLEADELAWLDGTEK